MIQIQLQPEIEARLAAEAQARGMALDRYIAQKLTEAASESLEPENAPARLSTRLSDLESFFQEMARYSGKVPVLPDEAFDRESFYRDRY